VEKRKKRVGVCLEVKNRHRLLEEFLLPGPMVAAPLALLSRTVQANACSVQDHTWKQAIRKITLVLQNQLTHGLSNHRWRWLLQGSACPQALFPRKTFLIWDAHRSKASTWTDATGSKVS